MFHQIKWLSPYSSGIRSSANKILDFFENLPLSLEEIQDPPLIPLEFSEWPKFWLLQLLFWKAKIKKKIEQKLFRFSIKIAVKCSNELPVQWHILFPPLLQFWLSSRCGSASSCPNTCWMSASFSGWPWTRDHPTVSPSGACAYLDSWDPG